MEIKLNVKVRHYESATLPDKSKECSYKAENQKCVEKAKEATCNFNDQDPKSCTSSLPSKIKCELKEDESGCVAKNVECSDFEDNQSGCNDAIISDSNKKCEYDSSKFLKNAAIFIMHKNVVAINLRIL